MRAKRRRSIPRTPNRRHSEEALGREAASAGRHQQPRSERALWLALWVVAALAIAAVVVLERGSFRTPTDTRAVVGLSDAAAPRHLALSESGYIDSIACAGCHQEIWKQFRKLGKGRSFSQMRPEVSIADFDRGNTYYHPASDRHYRMYRKGDLFYMQRSQRGPDGKPISEVEKRIDYVLGSGYKARAYLTRNSQGELLQLPVAWYTDRGGFWAMNPGYDRPDHDGFSRRVRFDCMFCHNGYFETGPAGDELDADPVYGDDLPEGIDCQRCHGPGQPHLDALANEAPEAEVRASVVNPGRLAPERQLEICFQCHLQSTSFRLPYASHRPGRGVLSYRPGEPLADYILHFDHPAGSGYDDKFEIAHAAYRLRKSRCFQASAGDLTCTTCHNPHRHLSQNPNNYTSVCLDCHQKREARMPADSPHRASADCLDCHMPQRRTDDGIHVVMTDHLIRARQPARNLLAPREEIIEGPDSGYRGEVVLSYPPTLPATPENALDLAVAQVEAGANLEEGLPRLRRAVATHRPSSHHYYFELAEASFNAGNLEEAFTWWEETIRRKPDFLPALRNYGKELAEAGRFDRAIEVLQRVLAIREGDPRSLRHMALSYFLQGKSAAGLSALRKALAADPDDPEAHSLLATQLYAAGDISGAEKEFLHAIRWNPRHRTAHADLASLLAEQGRLEQAEHHFQIAVAVGPDNGKGRHDYGIFLVDHRQRFEDAIPHLRAAVRLDPESAAARIALGYALSRNEDLSEAIQELQIAIARAPTNPSAHFYLAGAFERREELPQARVHYEEAVRYDPSNHLAHYGLGAVLAKLGEIQQALRHFETAAQSSNSELSEIARNAVQLLQADSQP